MNQNHRISARRFFRDLIPDVHLARQNLLFLYFVVTATHMKISLLGNSWK
jgi:hypothetical protein